MPTSLPSLGYGLGLRSEYYQQILEQSPPVDWFEVISENYLVQGGKALYYLDAIAERYPLVMHGVSLSIGGPIPSIPITCSRSNSSLSVSSRRGCPITCAGVAAAPTSCMTCCRCPTPKKASATCARVLHVQEVLQRPLVLENVSSYVRSKADEFTEWEFLNALAHLSGCQLLLDVNNVYVSSRNHGFDAWTFIRNLPPESIRQLHLAGHMDYGDYVVDTHDHPVCDPVWALYQQTLEHLGPVSTLLERDDHFPPFEELLTELNKARELGATALARRPLCA